MAEALAARDGVALALRRWPAAPGARGTVQIVHGLGEHAGRYEALAQALNAAGWHVAAHDLRGHGSSGGPRGGTPDAQAMLSDVAVVFDHLRAHPADVSGAGQHVLLGHSMGGLVASRFVAAPLLGPKPAWWREVDALVLSSPALDPGLNALERAALPLLRTLVPRLPLSNGIDASWICRDPEVVRRYREDPLVHGRVTPRLVSFIVEGGRAVLQAAPRWTTRTLLMWGAADRCVNPAGSAAFAAAAPAERVASRPWPGLVHEIFNEPERAAVIDELTRWLTGL